MTNGGIMRSRKCAKNKRRTALYLGMLLILGISAIGCGEENTTPESQEAKQTESSVENDLESSGETEVEQEERLGLGTFEAKTLDGQIITQEDIAKKDATLINFWATYCGPCIEELPEIAELEKALPDHVQIMTVCLDAGTETDSVKKILEGAGFEGATLVSGDGGLAAVVGEIMYTPTTIVVDADGYVVGDAIIGGQADLAKVYTAAINEVLKASGKEEIEYAEE